MWHQFVYIPLLMVISFAFAGAWKLLGHMYAQRKKKFSKTTVGAKKSK